MKPDERAFLAAIVANHGHPYGLNYAGSKTAREIAASLSMNEKRAFGLLLKWADRGQWEYGVNAFGGWFTPEGFRLAQERLAVSDAP